MIVDTSALMAVVKGEPGAGRILTALVDEPGLVPAPALVEFHRVAHRAPDVHTEHAMAILTDLLDRELSVLPFTTAHAEAATAANERFGAGVAKRGMLNLLDLMVYACAKVERRPILCTGLDFASTDAAIHPASRRG